MPDAQQMSVASNQATIAAMADVLAAVGSAGGIMQWADEAPVTTPAGRPVSASGATIGHGRIRLRDSAPPTLAEVAPAPAALDDGS